MNWARNKWRYLGLTTLTAFMLTQYQNCAPVHMSDTGNSSSVSNKSSSISAAGGGTVDIIDHNVGATDLSFPVNSIEVSATAANFSVQGVCPQMQTGAVLHWTLSDAQSNLVEEGYVDCQSTAFTVSVVVDPSKMPCNEVMVLQAHLGMGQPAITSVTRNCQ